MLMPLMEVLARIHEQGLIHRDISPDNIRIVGQRVKLMDFGAAKDVSSGPASMSVVVKPGYAPEEQYRSKGNQGSWTDVYALSATMYKCITGITPDEAVQRAYNDELQTPTELGIQMDSKQESALMKGMEVYQRNRYQTVGELIDGLMGREETATAILRADQTILLDEEACVEKKSAKKPKNIKRRKRMAVIVPLFLLVIGAVVLLVRDKDEKEPVDNKDYWQSVENDATSTPTSTPMSTAEPTCEPTHTAVAKVKVCGETLTISKTTRLSLADETITVEDMEAMAKLIFCKSLIFQRCVFEEGALEALKDTNLRTETLIVEDCTGVSDLSFVSNGVWLRFLSLVNCELTDEVFATINFVKLEKLTYIYLNNNGGLTDVAPLASCPVETGMTEVDLSGTAVTDLTPVTKLGSIYILNASDMLLEDPSLLLSSIEQAEIWSLHLNNNNITDISSLALVKGLKEVYLANNQIEDLSDLASNELYTLDVSGNQLKTLTTLGSVRELRQLWVGNNPLTTLAGLTDAIRLTSIYANNCGLTSIDSLTNCTILEEVNLNDNELVDISVLLKSADALERLSFDNNRVKQLPYFQGAEMPKLKYLSFDNNSVESLDAIADLSTLEGLSANNNKISNIYALYSCKQLKYIYLSGNLITDFYVLDNLADKEIYDLDLSNNLLEKLPQLSCKRTIREIAIDGNAISSFEGIEDYKGETIILDYGADLDVSVLRENYNRIIVLDCPLDRQLEYESVLGTRVTFATASDEYYVVPIKMFSWEW